MRISEQSHDMPYEIKEFQYNVQRRVIVIMIIKDECYAKDQYVNQRKNMSGNYCRPVFLNIFETTAR